MDRPPLPALNSPRLRLRGLRSGDENLLVTLDTDPVVMQFIHDGALSPGDARAFAESQIGLAEFRSRWGKWIVELRESSASIGWVELGKLSGPKRNDLQVGYEFAPAFWGHGYAVEAVRAVVQYALTKLQLDRVAALVDPENGRSLRLLRKLGFELAPEPWEPPDPDAPVPGPVRLCCTRLAPESFAPADESSAV